MFKYKEETSSIEESGWCLLGFEYKNINGYFSIKPNFRVYVNVTDYMNTESTKISDSEYEELLDYLESSIVIGGESAKHVIEKFEKQVKKCDYVDLDKVDLEEKPAIIDDSVVFLDIEESFIEKDFYQKLLDGVNRDGIVLLFSEPFASWKNVLIKRGYNSTIEMHDCYGENIDVEIFHKGEYIPDDTGESTDVIENGRDLN